MGFGGRETVSNSMRTVKIVLVLRRERKRERERERERTELLCVRRVTIQRRHRLSLYRKAEV